MVFSYNENGRFASDISRCIICGKPTRSAGNDSWIQLYGIRVCGLEHLKMFEGKYYRSLHTPDWYKGVGMP